MVYTIETNLLSLSFDSNHININSIKNKLSGDDYIKYDGLGPILSLFSLQDGDLVQYFPNKTIEAIKFDKDNYKSLMIKLGFNFNCLAIIRILLTNDNRITWTVEIQNDSDLEIVEILFPRIRGIYLGNTWKDDIIIFPHHAGEKTINPIEEYLKSCYKNMFRAQTQYDGEVYYREINYCGLASMTWLYYYDGENGLYFSSEDNKFPLTGIRVEISGDSTKKWIGFAIRKYTRLKPHSTWKSADYVAIVSCKDWHYGAKEYRKWIGNYINILPNPQYLDDECVLMNMYHFKREGQIYYRFDDIPRLFDYAKSWHINHFFMAGWNRKGFDQNYPEYYPDIELGTSMDLYNGCEYINKKGGIPTFYINSRIFDINSDYYDTIGKEMAIKSYSGELISEQYGDYKFVVSCPSFYKFQKHIIDTAYWMAFSYKAKGIYLDQLGSATPHPCYDQNHMHEDISEFNKGYIYILKSLREKLSKLNSDIFLMIENCGDIYSSYVWGNLTWNSDVRDEFFNLYKYTFPEYVQINMVNPISTDNKKLREEDFYRKLERAILLGSVLWVNPLIKFNYDDKTDKQMLDFLRKTIQFRRQINNYINSHKFVDNQEITETSKAIKATSWVCEESIMYIIGNRLSEEDQYIDIPYIKGEMYSIDIENRSSIKKMENMGDKTRIYINNSKLMLILLKIKNDCKLKLS